MAEQYTSETVTLLVKDTTKKVELVDRRLDSLSKKVDKKIDSLDSKFDTKFSSLNYKFDAYADKVDELIGKISDRVSMTEAVNHENDKKIQYLDIVVKNKVNDLTELESKMSEHSRNLTSLHHNFNIKVSNEEFLKKNNQEKNTKIKIYAAIISTVIGIISFIIPHIM